jgi:hypothetical protein
MIYQKGSINNLWAYAYNWHTSTAYKMMKKEKQLCSVLPHFQIAADTRYLAVHRVPVPSQHYYQLAISLNYSILLISMLMYTSGTYAGLNIHAA